MSTALELAKGILNGDYELGSQELICSISRSLANALIEAAKDTERLEWIERNEGETSAEDLPTEDDDDEPVSGWSVYGVIKGADRDRVVSAQAETLRAAIDAAREKA